MKIQLVMVQLQLNPNPRQAALMVGQQNSVHNEPKNSRRTLDLAILRTR